MTRAVLWLIRRYQAWISPGLGEACRYHPSCSEFAHDAVVRHGMMRGGGLALRRVARCHPFAQGGYDPVP